MIEEEKKLLKDFGFANVIQFALAYVGLQQENHQLKEKIKGIQEERDYLFNKSSIENKYLSQENNQLAEKVINQRFALGDTNKKIQELKKQNKQYKKEKKKLNARIEKAFKYIDYYVRIDDEHYETLKKIL